MAHKANTGVRRFLFENRFLLLIILIITALLVGSFIQDYLKLRYLFDLTISAIFMFAMYAIVEKKYQLIITVCLAVPMFVSLWTKYFMDLEALSVTGEICGIFFFGYSIYCIANYLFKQREVNRETIFAALVIYMLMAFMWARAYGLVEVIHPGSFGLPDEHAFGNRVVYLYYSFVTITTLGYGDITPLTDKASGLAIVEAITGQFYLVVLVAWLVGMHVSKRAK
jgi:voltage-gated potassium channel